MQQCPPGAMLSVAMSANEMKTRYITSLQDNLSLAAINAPELCVISGTETAIAYLASTLSQKGIACRQLHTSHGFHSAMMDSILDEFITSFDHITLHPPQLPFISNVTGTWITSEEATNPQYWAKHLRETVRFSEGIKTILENPNRILLEIGAGKTLATLAKQQQIITESNLICLTSLPSAKQKNNTDEISNKDSDFIFNTLGKLWLSGVEIDWKNLYQNQTPYRIPLPTYPFERKRYWVDRNAIDYTNTNLLNKNTESKTKEVIKTKKSDLKDWCYIPSWQRSQPLTNSSLESVEKYTCLLFANDNLLSQELQVNLKQLRHNVISVSTGSQFIKDNNLSYRLNPDNCDDYVSLIRNLQQQDKIPQKIIYLWSISKVRANRESPQQDFKNLIYLTQALTSQHLTKPLQLSIITNDIQEVTGTEKLDPYKSMVLGACQVIPQEYPQIITHNIDLETNNLGDKLVLSNLIKDILTLPQENIVAYRNNYKWEKVINSFPIKEFNSTTFKQQGTYLIAGDLVEGLGLMYASYLVKEYQANLILIGRENLPPQLEWQQWLKNNQNHVAYNLINSLQQLSTSGTKLLFLRANLTDESAIKPLITEAKNKFINIDGVIHGGTMGDNYACSIPSLTDLEIEKQLQTKIAGLITLEKALANTKLDFFLLQSSLSSIVGGVGFAAYTAVNIFMDNYAAIKNKEGNTAWYSINWDGYDSDRLSVETNAYSLTNKITENKNNSTGLDLVDLAITPDEAWEISKRVLANDVSQVIVSPTDLQPRIEQWIKPKTLAEIDKIMAAKSLNALANQKKADVTAEYVAPRNEIEIAVVKAMEELLGINTIGVNDNFFELGGHSLLAIQIVSRLRDEFEIDIPMREFLFESPTAAKIAHVINNKLLEVEIMMK